MIMKTEYMKSTEGDFVNVYYPDWVNVVFFQNFKYMAISFGKKNIEYCSTKKLRNLYMTILNLR